MAKRRHTWSGAGLMSVMAGLGSGPAPVERGGDLGLDHLGDIGAVVLGIHEVLGISRERGIDQEIEERAAGAALGAQSDLPLAIVAKPRAAAARRRQLGVELR